MNSEKIGQCREIISRSQRLDCPVINTLHPVLLLWMCDLLEKNANAWPDMKMQRWIGFVQCGMYANDMIDFDDVLEMCEQPEFATLSDTAVIQRQV